MPEDYKFSCAKSHAFASQIISVLKDAIDEEVISMDEIEKHPNEFFCALQLLAPMHVNRSLKDETTQPIDVITLNSIYFVQFEMSLKQYRESKKG